MVFYVMIALSVISALPFIGFSIIFFKKMHNKSMSLSMHNVIITLPVLLITKIIHIPLVCLTVCVYKYGFINKVQELEEYDQNVNLYFEMNRVAAV